MTTRAEIEAEFEGVRDPAVLKGLARLCDTFRVTAEELSAEWDIVELNAATSRALSLDALADLEGQVKASQAKKKARQLAKETKAQHTTRAPPPSTFTKDSAHLLQSGALGAAPSQSTRVTTQVGSGILSWVLSQSVPVPSHPYQVVWAQ